MKIRLLLLVVLSWTGVALCRQGIYINAPKGDHLGAGRLLHISWYTHPPRGRTGLVGLEIYDTNGVKWGQVLPCSFLAADNACTNIIAYPGEAGGIDLTLPCLPLGDYRVRGYCLTDSATTLEERYDDPSLDEAYFTVTSSVASSSLTVNTNRTQKWFAGTTRKLKVRTSGLAGGIIDAKLSFGDICTRTLVPVAKDGAKIINVEIPFEFPASSNWVRIGQVGPCGTSASVANVPVLIRSPILAPAEGKTLYCGRPLTIRWLRPKGATTNTIDVCLIGNVNDALVTNKIGTALAHSGRFKWTPMGLDNTYSVAIDFQGRMAQGKWFRITSK